MGFNPGGGGGPGGVLPAGNAVGNLLQWDGSSWIPVLAPTGTGQIAYWDNTLSTWVLVTAPATGEFFQYDATTGLLVPAGTPAATGDILVWDGATRRWTKLAAGTTGQSLVVSAANTLAYKDNRDTFTYSAINTGSSTNPRFLFPGQGSVSAATATETQCQLLAVRPGSIVGAYSNYRAAALAAANTTYTVRKNAVDQTVTWTVNATVQTGSDLAHSFSFVAGDLISVKSVTSAGDATASNPAVSLLVQPG